MKNDELFEDVNFGEVFGGLEDILEDNPTPTIEKEHPKKEEIKKPAKETKSKEVLDNEDNEEVVEDDTLETPPSFVDKEIEDDNDSSSDYRVFAKALYESGVIQDFNEESFNKLAEDSGIEEALISLVSSTIDKEVNSKISLKDEQYKEIVKKLEDGVPQEVVATQFSDMKKLNSISEEALQDNEDLAKNVIAVELKYRGYSDDRIAQRIERLEESGILGDEAVESLESLKHFRKKEIDEEDKKYRDSLKTAEEKKKERFNQVKNSIYSTDELVPGIKLNQVTKDKILGILSKPVASKDGRELNAIMQQREKNPIEFDKMVAYLYHIGVFNFDNENRLKPNWDKILKKSKTNAVEELSNRFSKPSNRKKGGSPIQRFGTELDEAESFISSIDIKNFGKSEPEK